MAAIGKFTPAGRTRLLAWLGRRFGPTFLLPMLLAEEGREVKSYLDLHRETPKGAAGGEEALLLARESKEHASTIAGLAGREGEPWHATESGGLLRNVIYGFNDGLTANFGLVAGVIGATALAQDQAIIVAGVAGLIADALSMGASGYLAAKSEQEVYAHEIAMEKDEIALMPEIERDELALIYEAKGMQRASRARARDGSDGGPCADAEGAGAGGAQDRRARGVAAARGVDHRHGDGDRRAHPVFPFFIWRGPDRDLAVVHAWRWRATSWSAPRAASSPGAACSAPGSTCSWSAWAWRRWDISWGSGWRGSSHRVAYRLDCCCRDFDALRICGRGMRIPGHDLRSELSRALLPQRLAPRRSTRHPAFFSAVRSGSKTRPSPLPYLPSRSRIQIFRNRTGCS